MGRQLTIRIRRRMVDDDWDADKVLAGALAERAQFLEDHPRHRPFQDEIDRILDRSGTPERRMAVLLVMIEGRLIELRRHFILLGDHLTRLAA